MQKFHEFFQPTVALFSSSSKIILIYTNEIMQNGRDVNKVVYKNIIVYNKIFLVIDIPFKIQ